MYNKKLIYNIALSFLLLFKRWPLQVQFVCLHERVVLLLGGRVSGLLEGMLHGESRVVGDWEWLRGPHLVDGGRRWAGGLEGVAWKYQVLLEVEILKEIFFYYLYRIYTDLQTTYLYIYVTMLIKKW